MKLRVFVHHSVEGLCILGWGQKLDILAFSILSISPITIPQLCCSTGGGTYL